MTNYWTEEEIAYLKEHADLPIKEQAAYLGRSVSAVTIKRSRFGIAPKQPSVKGKKRWTDDEEQFLIDSFMDLTDKELGEKLNRSAESIRTRRTKLGLSRTNSDPWTEQELNFIRENHEDYTNEELGEHIGRLVHVVLSMKQKMGLTSVSTPWTEDEDQFLRSNLDLTDWELGEKLNRTTSAIENRRSRLGLDKLDRWTDEETEFLLTQMSKLNDKQIAKRLNRTKKAVQHKRMQLDLTRVEQESHEVNEDFFKTWTHEMSYILGFIYGDGNIRAANNNQLTFNITDKKLLEKINNAMKSTYPIILRKRKQTTHKQQYHLSISRKMIVDDLMALGLEPNKSLTMALPDIPPLYFFDFVRGYFDADGHVNHREGLYILMVSGSQQFLASLAEELFSYDIHTSLYSQENGYNGIYQLYIKKKGRKLFYTKLYENSTIHLQRKKDVFDNYYNNVLIITCQDCDKKMKRKGSNHKRCADCQQEHKNAYERRRYYYNKYGTLDSSVE